MSEEESSLRVLFSKAKERQESLDTLETQSSAFLASQRSAIEALEACKQLVLQTALFSSNEEFDDVSTENLQYLAVDCILAELLLRSYGQDRQAQLQYASKLLENFLNLLDQYNLLSQSDQRLFERYRENRQSFSVISAASAEERRNRKVARFKEEKALKNKLKMLRDQSNVNNVDDETQRDLYIAELAFYVHQTFQSLDLVSQELSMLSQAPNAGSNIPSGPDLRERSKNGNGYSERLDGQITMNGLGRKGGPLLSPSGKPLQPFTLTDKRTQLQKGVFRPGHNLPTMSIDEYLEEEKKRGGIIDGGGQANATQPEPDEDNMELVDAATMKARDWDEFVEANPKGAGNTLNRG